MIERLNGQMLKQIFLNNLQCIKAFHKEDKKKEKTDLVF
jgi:hypothetical protein